MNEKQIKAAWTAIKPNQVDKAIAEATPLVAEIKSRKMRRDEAKEYKMKIAEIALRVCPIDGRELNRIADRDPNVSTIAEFSKQIGVKYGTLRHWTNAFPGGDDRPIGVPAGNPIAAKATVYGTIDEVSGSYLARTINFRNVVKARDSRFIPTGVKEQLTTLLMEILDELVEDID
jgi:hypothetical protein